MASRSVAEADKLNRLTHDEIICKCKNNLAFFLAVRGNASDAEKARNLGNYICRVAMSEQSRTHKCPYIYRATWASVLWRFYKKDKPSKKEAYKIAKELLEDATISSSERERFKEGWMFIEQKPFDQIIEELKSD